MAEQARLEDSLTPDWDFAGRHHTRESLARLILEAKEPRIDRTWQLVNDQYFERVDGKIRGLVATVQGSDLARMITDPEDALRPLLEMFQENARVYLTQKNKINKRIFASALSERNIERAARRGPSIATALANGTKLEDVQRPVGHADQATTQLYDRGRFTPQKSAALVVDYGDTEKGSGYDTEGARP
jgi:hypothetical protein